MVRDDVFDALLVRVRAGDETACNELVSQYGPEIRRVVRIRLREPLLRSTIDTTDILQSVLMDFFARVKLGQYEFDSPRDLVRLLMTMARHKLLNHARHARIEKRTAPVGMGETGQWLGQVPDRAESPSAAIVGEELIEMARHLLTEEERVIAEHRRAGRDWNEIANLTGDTPEAARKRLARAIDRVFEILGLRPERE